MKRPAAMWETDYRHDRRKHRHRCQGCNRIVATGERVLMATVSGGKTRVLHLTPCADRIAFTAAQSNDGTEWTSRRLLEAQGNEHLRRLGWKLAEAA